MKRRNTTIAEFTTEYLSMDVMHVNSKKCCKCKETKPAYQFSFKTDTRDGLQKHCRKCSQGYRDTLKQKQQLQQETQEPVFTIPETITLTSQQKEASQFGAKKYIVFDEMMQRELINEFFDFLKVKYRA